MLSTCIGVILECVCPTHVQRFAEEGKIVCAYDSQVPVRIHITPQPSVARVCAEEKASLTSTSGQQERSTNVHSAHAHQARMARPNVLKTYY